MNMHEAVQAFQLAEQDFGERMQARGILFDPALGVEAGLLAALPHLARIKAAEGVVPGVSTRRCSAHVVHPKPSPPGPGNPPLWCCLREGHGGPHRHDGGGMYPSIPFRENDEVSMLAADHQPAQAAMPEEGHCVRVLSCDGEWEGEALWEVGEGCYVTRVPVHTTVEPVAQGEAVPDSLLAEADEMASELIYRGNKQMSQDHSDWGSMIAKLADALRLATQPRAVPDEVVTELVEAATEVYRISDREHEAWHRLRAALSAAQEADR